MPVVVVIWRLSFGSYPLFCLVRSYFEGVVIVHHLALSSIAQSRVIHHVLLGIIRKSGDLIVGISSYPSNGKAVGLEDGIASR